MDNNSLDSRSLSGILVLGYAVTPLHPGIGRAPGVVDLPVQRDPFGYPVVLASSVKGAFKAECARRVDASGGCFNNSGRIKCSLSSKEAQDNKCNLCCCLFGHEPESEEHATGLLSVLDFTPLFIPVPSLSHGYLYITSPYLAARAHSVLEALEASGVERASELKEFLKQVASFSDEKYRGCISGEIYLGMNSVKIDGDLGDKCNSLKNIIADSLEGLSAQLASRLVVVPDSHAPSYVEKAMIRITRVRLRLDTKTVSERSLWTEEYIPQGTIFLGGFIATLPKKNKYCTNGSDKLITSNEASKKVEEFIKLMSSSGNKCTAYMIVGGKETVGRGLVKLTIAPCKNNADEKRGGS